MNSGQQVYALISPLPFPLYHQVNLYSGELDPQFGDLFDAPARSLFEDSVYAKTHTVKMVVVTTTKEAMTLVKEAMDGSQADNMEGRLAENIKAAFATLSVRGGWASGWVGRGVRRLHSILSFIHSSRPIPSLSLYPHVQEIELGHVGFAVDKEIYVPSHNSPVGVHSSRQPIHPSTQGIHLLPPSLFLFSFPPQEHLTARHRSLGSHSAVLVDPEMTAVPTTHVKYGKTYHMYLENFPANTEVQLDLYKFKVRRSKREEEEKKDGGLHMHLILFSPPPPPF